MNETPIFQRPHMKGTKDKGWLNLSYTRFNLSDALEFDAAILNFLADF